MSTMYSMVVTEYTHQTAYARNGGHVPVADRLVELRNRPNMWFMYVMANTSQTAILLARIRREGPPRSQPREGSKERRWDFPFRPDHRLINRHYGPAVARYRNVVSSHGEPTQFVAMFHNENVGAKLKPNKIKYCISLVMPLTFANT